MNKSKNCKKCGKEFKKQSSDSYSYWVKKSFCSKKCSNSNGSNGKLKGIPRPESVTEVMKKTQFKKGSVPWNKGKSVLQTRGEKHHNWRGGMVVGRRKLMGSLEYKLWRKSVFERDNYTCVWCGQKGGILNADHIKPFSLYPEFRFAIDNGRTLCKPCHIKTDTFGAKVLYLKI